MYPMPTKISIYSPKVTAGGGDTVKKNSAWSAGAVKKMSIASVTASNPVSLGFLSHIETSPARGRSNPTVMKNTANASVRISFIRVSTPNGVKRKPKMNPNPNKTANMRSACVKGRRAGGFVISSDPFSGPIFVD